MIVVEGDVLRALADKVLPAVAGERLDVLQVFFRLLMQAAIEANGDPLWFGEGMLESTATTREFAARLKELR